jgi:hypothetical protein
MMPSRSRITGAGLNLLGLAGAAGTFVFGILAGEGGRGHVRNIVLGVLCATVPLATGVAAGFRSNRRIRAEVEARSKAESEAERIQAELISALRARLSSILHLLGTMAPRRPAGQVDELLGRLTQAVVGAAVAHQNTAPERRSIFFKASGDKMECAGYAGPEGQTEAAKTVFKQGSDDPLGAYMFRLLNEGRAVLLPNVAGPDVSVQFPEDRSYQTAIAAAVSAGDVHYGVLTLDAPEVGALGNTDLEIIKTLASLLGVGMALASSGSRRKPNTPQQDEKQ